MRRQTTVVVAVALAALLVGAGVAAALGGTTAAEPTAANGGSTISVGATGSAETTPDRAILRVAVVATGDSASDVREQLATDVTSMRDAVRDAGVNDSQVRTSHYDISQNYEARENPDAPAYRGYHGFQITLDDIDAVGAVIDAAVEGGATRVENVQFTLSEERERELRSEALADAMANADSQASTLAEAGDLTLAGVHSISTSQGYGGPIAYETAAADGARTSIESGPVSVTVNVQVTYNATSS